MKTDEYKYKEQMTPESVPEFLRKLANALETEPAAVEASQASGEFGGLIRNYQKISIDIKPKTDLVSIRLKVKKSPPQASALLQTTAEPQVNADQARPEYKRLKKQMQAAFKTIQASIGASRLPEEDLLYRFCDDAALMVTYPGKGDAHYVRYTQAVAHLKTAFERKDYIRFKSAVEIIDRLKKECHQQYK